MGVTQPKNAFAPIVVPDLYEIAVILLQNINAAPAIVSTLSGIKSELDNPLHDSNALVPIVSTLFPSTNDVKL